MSLFTVNRYLGDSSLDSEASPGNKGQSILDKINAKAKARQEQRKQTPLKVSSPASVSKVTDAAPRKPASNGSPSSHTPGTGSAKRKKKKKSIVRPESNDAVPHDKDRDALLPQFGEMRKEDIDKSRDEDVAMVIRDAASLTPKERKQRVIERGLVAKDSVVTKKKKGKRKNDEGKEKDINEMGEDAKNETAKKTRLEMVDGESLEHSPSVSERTKEKVKSLQKKDRKKERKRTDRTDKDPTSEDNEHEQRHEEVEGGEEEKMEDKMEEKEDGEMEEEDGEEDKEEHHNFLVLGDFERKHKKKVHEALPDWLARPSIIKQSLTNDLKPVNSIVGLDERLIAALAAMGVTKFFPVQQHVIPILLESLKYGIHTGHAGFRPTDLCISAPTGSGKTLAYALPIIQALMNRVVCRVRALVVLPTRDLATQVYKIISSLCKTTPLKAVLVGGTKKFTQEQNLLVKEIDGEFHSLADIVVATPGRLVDNINQTAGFNLQHLRFLVIDEADRLMEHISQDWIAQVEKSAYTPQSDNGTFLPAFTSNRQRTGPLTINRSSSFQLPLQKLLFSATLSQNPEKLTQLRLFQPRLITTATSNRDHPISGWNLDGNNEGKERVKGMEEKGEEKNEGRTDFVGKYTTPTGLLEYYVQCTAGEKPLVLQHFLLNLYFKQVLCFTNSVQTTHRLYLLLKLMGDIEVAEFSSNLSQSERQNILKQFKAGKLQILICSDAMARGMDIDNVRCVISYDLPPHLKTYIHRIGRTARAGRGGTAFSFVRKKEVSEFKHMLKNAGKEGIQRHTVSTNQLEALTPAYTEALSQLSSMLREEKAHQY